MPYRQHLKSPGDLETSYAAVRAGFVALALERNRRATPYVEEARTLKVLASKASCPTALLKIGNIRPALLTAAGVSDKAAGHMQEADKEEAIQGLIAKFLEPAGSSFVEELVFRFLLTRGDTLGGSMRNVGGELARRKLTRALLATLSLAGIPYRWLNTETGTWLEKSKDDSDIEMRLGGLSWDTNRKRRTAIYNLSVPLVGKNVDISLLNCAPEQLAGGQKNAKKFVALGELKGGIDPAGADEHWKTARTALLRIRSAFADEELNPKIFFVGAAIVPNMAKEIWGFLQDGRLTNAANLTGDKQLTSICRWLLGL